MELGFLNGNGDRHAGAAGARPAGADRRGRPRWCPSASSGGSPYVPGVPLGAVSPGRRARPASWPGSPRSRRTSTSPPSTWWAWSSRRRARTRATPCCRPSPRRPPTPAPAPAPAATPAPSPVAYRWSRAMSLRHALLAAALAAHGPAAAERPAAALPLPGATPDLLLLVMMALAWCGALAGRPRSASLPGLLLDLVPPADGPWACAPLIVCLVGWIAGLAADAVERSALVVLLWWRASRRGPSWRTRWWGDPRPTPGSPGRRCARCCRWRGRLRCAPGPLRRAPGDRAWPAGSTPASAATRVPLGVPR